MYKEVCLCIFVLMKYSKKKGKQGIGFIFN